MPSNQVNGTDVNDSETKAIDAKKPIKLLRGALRRNELFSSLYLEIDDDERSRNTEHSLVSSSSVTKPKLVSPYAYKARKTTTFSWWKMATWMSW